MIKIYTSHKRSSCFSIGFAIPSMTNVSTIYLTLCHTIVNLLYSSLFAQTMIDIWQYKTSKEMNKIILFIYDRELLELLQMVRIKNGGYTKLLNNTNRMSTTNSKTIISV